MEFKQQNITLTCPEQQIIEQYLELDNKKIIELGCGKADITRLIATTGKNRRIIATEVDEQQHALNLKLDDLPNVQFELAGAQNIPAKSNSIDQIFMFKSLHHVPEKLMDTALNEITRVLKPGGGLYVSEPLFQGDFNEVLRLFHDEEKVRKAAYATLQRTIANGSLEFQQQLFFNIPAALTSFDLFEQQVINVTHSDHQLSSNILAQIREKYQAVTSEHGGQFEVPIRVDMLKKPTV